ncbi:MAG: hypothetical protein DRN71_04975 [Candidatus Nanohalarchaeota archaeon]|nr:MAG: hypothetical protein DRN71_04975 [Candidatus Nanohaloarchaeota archaeon]
MGCVSRVLNDSSALDALLEYGFSDAPRKSEYETRRLAGGCAVVLYKSGKVVIQGKDNVVSEVERIVFGDVSVKEKMKIDGSAVVRIGGDECLKGDTFGGLVVCCVRADAKIRGQLFSLGVSDSKKIADAKIRKMGAQVLRVLGHDNVAVVEVYHVDYNRLYLQYMSVTRMLNVMYEEAVGLIGNAEDCVIDQYPGCRVRGCKSLEKGESKYIEIAAASVVARYRGLLQMDSLSMRGGFEVPKGSTHVKWGLIRLKREKRVMNEFVKMHFRNVSGFLCADDQTRQAKLI